MSSDLIVDAAGVAELAERARRAGRFALDLEFLWERTYAPVACLAQLAVDDEIALVDPIQGAPLEPISEIVADPEIEVVMHAPSADLTLLGLAFDTRPAALLDVQMTAGFVGLGSGQGLGALLDRALSVRLDKSERYTDWSRRPLSERQLDYAAADVAHLLELADVLLGRAEERGREEWVREEHVRRYGPGARFVPDPEEAWRRIRGQGRLSAQERAVLARLAAWRERTARDRDRPTSWLIPDRVLLEIARRRPTDRPALSRERGMPERSRPEDLDEILAAIKEGMDSPGITLDGGIAPRLVARLDAITPLAAALVATRAGAEALAPTLVATRDEIQRFLASELADEPPTGPLAEGWRRELVGRALVDLADGRLALTGSPTQPFVTEVSTPRRARAAQGTPTPGDVE